MINNDFPPSSTPPRRRERTASSEIGMPMDSSQSPSLNDQRGPNRAADSRAIAIHVSPHDQLANYPPSFGRRTFLTLANFFIAARDRLASYRPSFGRRTSATLASFFIATLIGVAAALVWQSQRVSTPNDVVIAEKQSDFTPVGQLSLQVAPPQPAPVTQTAPASTAHRQRLLNWCSSSRAWHEISSSCGAA